MSTSKPKTARPAAANDDKIGYKRPPKGAQWAPGRSGNPKGRPKGSKSLATILREELDKPIQARVGGRVVSVSRREALVQKQLEMALRGDQRAFATLLKLDPTALRSDESEGVRDAPLSKAEQEAFAGFFARAAAPDGEGA